MAAGPNTTAGSGGGANTGPPPPQSAPQPHLPHAPNIRPPYPPGGPYPPPVSRTPGTLRIIKTHEIIKILNYVCLSSLYDAFDNLLL